MKKFLFTLAALLMATSAYAAEKFWVDAEPFLNATPGVEFTVPVHAQFDGMVSAWTMDLGTIVDGEFVENVLPAGIAVTYFEKGVDMKITFKNSRGRDATVEASLGSSQNDTRFISATSTSDQEYYQVDGAWVAAGVVKWLPDTYDEMVLLYFETTEEYDGTPIAIRCQPTCGNDARDIPRSDGTTTVTPWYSDEPTPVPADKPVITVNNDNTTAVSFTIAGEEGATIYYKYGNMTEYAVYTGEVTETVEGNYTVEAYAVGPNGKTESEHETANFTVAAPAPVPADKPVITITNNNTTEVGISIAAEEGAEIYYEITEAGAKAYTQYTDAFTYTTPGTYTIEAYAVGPNGKTESVHATENFTVKAPAQPSTPGDIQVVVTPTTYEVTPTGPNAQLIVDGEPVNGAYVVPRPAYGQPDINVTVTVRTDNDGDGEDFYPTNEDKTFVVKAQLPEPNIVATPGQASEDEGHTNQVDGHYYDVTFEAPAGYTVHYIINGPNGAHFEGNWVAGDDPIHVTADGTYSVEAYTVDGEDRSTSDTDTFVISPKTGVNELMNGKTVASQRFFNLAGQEMTEANGVTIVVTTYTDGTTSAVKVMK